MSSIVEIAKIRAHPGRGDELESALPRAVAAIKSDPGYQGAKIHRCIERPDEFVLMIVWESIEAHTAFRDSPELQAYRQELAGPFERAVEFAHYHEAPTP
jgi:heme-degrading monooxygenase HmoA